MKFNNSSKTWLRRKTFASVEKFDIQIKGKAAFGWTPISFNL